MSSKSPVVVWFRQDLRLADNPALTAAAKTGAAILPIYILDDENAGDWAMGDASRWWLHQSLGALNKSLRGQLRYFRGAAEKLLPQIVSELGAKEVHWNRCYEPWRIKRDILLKEALHRQGVRVRSHNGSLLFEPQHVKKANGTPYKVFTPYYRRGCLGAHPAPRPPVDVPESMDFVATDVGKSLKALELLPRINWYNRIEKEWQPGEIGAARRLQEFLTQGIGDYKAGRNRPDQHFVSRLSPHLHFGEISPQRIWHASLPFAERPELVDEVDHFQSELAWREFSYSLLFHWPEISHNNLQRKFDRFPWRDDPESLSNWQRGRTGYPLVDAGMRELWETGYMHNRVRMIVASFLVKNLLLHWRHGAKWFWDTLLDADLASNSASWQWVAGCGADAAPYFRIFNPVTQGQKFDPDGIYVRTYVPELTQLPNKYVHCPWLADDKTLVSSDVRLGDNYPVPIVDLKESRERALAAFKTL